MKTFYCITVIILFAFAAQPVFSDNAKQVGKTEKKREKKKNPILKKLMSRISADEKAKLVDLQKNDLEAFRKELKFLTTKYKLNRSKQSDEVKGLVDKYKATEDETAKAEILEELKKVVREEFNKSIENYKKNYEKASKRLEELKEKIETREADAEKIISNRIRNLTGKPKPRKEKAK